jgi:NAD+ diphosphatase
MPAGGGGKFHCFLIPISMLHTPDRFTPLLEDFDAEREQMFVFHPEGVMLRKTDLALPEAAACRELDLLDGRVHTVGLLDGCLYRCMTVGHGQLPAAGYAYRTLRSLFGIWSDELLAVASRASQIAEWARSHRYCGACGTPTELTTGERCLRCPACGRSFYPRVSPSMMVLVKNGDAILLARNGSWALNRFSALAGFVEPGESVEEAVHREVQEEVGLRVHDLHYFGSQSWPFPHSLMIAFTAEYLSGDIRVDETEIAEARWFGPGDPLPDIPTRISISSALIQANLPAAKR